jgi:hypothetical protein
MMFHNLGLQRLGFSPICIKSLANVSQFAFCNVTCWSLVFFSQKNNEPISAYIADGEMSILNLFGL